jgi:hypothetical protein
MVTTHTFSSLTVTKPPARKKSPADAERLVQSEAALAQRPPWNDSVPVNAVGIPVYKGPGVVRKAPSALRSTGKARPPGGAGGAAVGWLGAPVPSYVGSGGPGPLPLPVPKSANPSWRISVQVVDDANKPVELAVLKHVLAREQLLSALHDRWCERAQKAESYMLVEEVQRLTVQTVEAVSRWRSCSSQPLPFVYNGVNYLLKMIDDLNFVSALGSEWFVKGLARHVGHDSGSFSMVRNPFLAREPLPSPGVLTPRALGDALQERLQLGRAVGSAEALELEQGVARAAGLAGTRDTLAYVPMIEERRVEAARHILLLEEAFFEKARELERAAHAVVAEQQEAAAAKLKVKTPEGRESAAGKAVRLERAKAAEEEAHAQLRQLAAPDTAAAAAAAAAAARRPASSKSSKARLEQLAAKGGGVKGSASLGELSAADEARLAQAIERAGQHLAPLTEADIRALRGNARGKLARMDQDIALNEATVAKLLAVIEQIEQDKLERVSRLPSQHRARPDIVKQLLTDLEAKASEFGNKLRWRRIELEQKKLTRHLFVQTRVDQLNAAVLGKPGSELQDGLEEEDPIGLLVEAEAEAEPEPAAPAPARTAQRSPKGSASGSPKGKGAGKGVPPSPHALPPSPKAANKSPTVAKQSGSKETSSGAAQRPRSPAADSSFVSEWVQDCIDEALAAILASSPAEPWSSQSFVGGVIRDASAHVLQARH